MSDGQALWLLVALFYLSECLCWVPRGAVAWRFGRRRRTARAGVGGLGNERGRVVFNNPLGCSGCTALFEPWPFAVTGSGVAREPSRHAALEAGHQVADWDTAGEVRASGRALLVGGTWLANCASAPAAAGFASMLESLRSGARENLSESIRHALDRSLDLDAAMGRWAAFSKDARSARSWAAVVAWSMLAAVPFVYWRFGDGPEVFVAAGVMWAAMALAAWSCFRLHRRWFPGDRRTRWQNVLVSLFAPPHAARAVDGVALHVMAGFHPLAPVARDVEERLFSDAVREAWNPLGGSASPARDGYRGQFLQPALESAATARGIRLAEALAAPAFREDGAASYCPRCLGSYAAGVETCADCHGVRLKEFR